MLSWPPGPHPDDGVWGAHWYNAVIGSTRFGPAPEENPAVDKALEAVVEECLLHFEAMVRHRLRV